LKVLYIAGTPEKRDSLLEIAEVTELALLLREPHEFVPLPDTPVNLLRGMINRFRPDVLHLAAHGESSAIQLRDFDGSAKPVTADTLQRYLVQEEPVALVYLNACNSAELAKSLAEKIPAAIGFEGRIANSTARHAALHFYEEVLAGKSILDAHDVSAAFVNTAAEGKDCRCVLEGSADAKRVRLCIPLTLLARISSANGESYGIELGLEGVPANTSQIVFYLSEPTLEDAARAAASGADTKAREVTLASALCRVIGRPRGKTPIWTAVPYLVAGNCNVFATLCLPERPAVTVSARLVDVLRKTAARDASVAYSSADIERLAAMI